MEETTVSQAEIEKLAYELWEQEGRPHGRDVVHYLEAERLLRERARTGHGPVPIPTDQPISRPSPRQKRRASPKTRKP